MKRFRITLNRKLRRRLAACAIGGCTALASAVSYATTAFDDASDPVYADGWQDGDNGGSGFTPWDFSSAYVFNGTHYAYSNPGFKEIDDGLQNGTHFSNPFNDVGRAWALGYTPDSDGTARAGRGFSLAVGETLRVTFDNPTERQFFKGYFIRLNGGTGGFDGNFANLGYGSTPGGTPESKLNFGTFEYFSYGEWFLNDGGASVDLNLFDTDTAEAGAILSLTRTGTETYDLSVDSLGGGPDISLSRTFDSPGAEVDWIEFDFFGPLTDTGERPTTATDLYIRSMAIVPEPGTGVLLSLGLGAAGIARRRRDRK